MYFILHWVSFIGSFEAPRKARGRVHTGPIVDSNAAFLFFFSVSTPTQLSQQTGLLARLNYWITFVCNTANTLQPSDPAGSVLFILRGPPGPAAQSAHQPFRLSAQQQNCCCRCLGVRHLPVSYHAGKYCCLHSPFLLRLAGTLS